MSGQNTNKRKRKPKELAVITDCCTGCAGSPVCQTLCPVENCMQLIHDDEHNPFGYIWVDPLKCIGCRQCIAQGVASRKELKDIFLIGCPWDAIQMTALEEVEKEYGVLEY
jgi:ferredoxin